MVVVYWRHLLALRVVALHRTVALSTYVDHADCGRVKDAGNEEVRWVFSPALTGLPTIARSPTLVSNQGRVHPSSPL